MSKTTFEKLGIPYEERDGIFYPVLVAGVEKADMERLGIAAKRKPAKVIDFAQYIENNRGTND